MLFPPFEGLKSVVSLYIYIYIYTEVWLKVTVPALDVNLIQRCNVKHLKKHLRVKECINIKYQPFLNKNDWNKNQPCKLNQVYYEKKKGCFQYNSI